MTDPGSRVTVAREDIEHAQAVIDAWLDYLSPDEPAEARTAYLRGLLTQAIADARAIGYTRGRQHLGERLRDLLDSEDC